MKIKISAPKAINQKGLFEGINSEDYSVVRKTILGYESIPCVKYVDDKGLFIVETRYNGFEFDWELEDDFNLCEYKLECPAGSYALYKLEGNLIGQRSESLKVEFGDTKFSMSGNSYDSNFPLGADWISTETRSVSLKLVMTGDDIPDVSMYTEHGFVFNMRCLNGVILDSGKLIHPVKGDQVGYNEVRDPKSNSEYLNVLFRTKNSDTWIP